MTKTKTLALPDLARAINREHKAVEKGLRIPLAHALEAGRLLRSAKRKLKHGEWGAWIRENCGFSHRTANGYMRLAEKLPNSQPVANIGVREGLNLVAESVGDGLQEDLESAREAAEAKAIDVTYSSIPVEYTLMGGGQKAVPDPKYHRTPEERRLRKVDQELDALSRFDEDLEGLQRTLYQLRHRCEDDEMRGKICKILRGEQYALERSMRAGK